MEKNEEKPFDPYKVLVRNLPRYVSETTIIKAFMEFGNVLDIKTKQNYAFLTFDKEESVHNVLNYPGDILVDGLTV